MRWIGYLVLATIAIVAVGFLLVVLNNARDGSNEVLEKASIAGIVATLGFVSFAVIVDRLRYRL